MKRITFPLLWLGLFVLLPLCGFAADRPNIIIILADDLGWGSVNCYGASKDLVKTPNIDRLAHEGRRFTDANTSSSVCSPSRYSVLTGRYCWRTSLKHEVLGVTSPLHIEPGRLTIASMLKKHGYNTAAIGKWHLGYGTGKTDYTKELKPGPLEIGFDYHLGIPGNQGDITGVYVENHKVLGLRSSKINKDAPMSYYGRPFMGLDAPQRKDDEVMDVLGDHAVNWIGKQDEQHPFFLYLTPVAIHEPVTPSAKNRGKSKAGPLGDYIQDLDLLVGRVLKVLDRKKISNNTLVIFTSDNGGVTSTGSKRLGPLVTEALNSGLKLVGDFRGGKHSVFDGGFRVPFIVRWPGKVPANTVSDDMLNLVDLLATTAAVVGEQLPPANIAAEDSYNQLPELLGSKHKDPIRPDMVLHSADGNFAIRQGPWKFIEGKFHPATKPAAQRARRAEFIRQLHNEKTDVGERRNDLDKHTSLANEMESRLNQYRDQGYSR